ncbi:MULTISPECIES: MBL fold metallo-hydrolase [unclassified Paenibacillus]|uniref:MBL fold metallo-hydrolase n=1 Tax=unclassified Paenibacillus TaxID=185978 RepID=UPI001C0FFE86|nr:MULTISPECIES: MBL fold metallo-hydrolase [unclassified Paenibacillus]MBU5440782.1 MBL fold metallo-hydrolase [Paenibacillus sp. MSJ-34]CAH0119175.1 hypothetical protein PAE9249_01674 [Paenibacillus sp. CECT 9249]
MGVSYPELTHWSGNITQVKIPLPFSLRWVNSYVVRGSGGYTLIDPGLHTEDAVQAWRKAMAELGLAFSDIEQIVLTHYHPDHYGLAGWFQRETGAPVWMSRIGCEHAQMMWGPEQTMTSRLHALYVRHGMEKSVSDQIIPHMDGFLPLVSPHPLEVRYIDAGTGQSFRIGDRHWLLVTAPGHAAGHLCFYDAETREMFCGDQVLPQISPNVSYLPGSDPSPLESFLESLRSLRHYEVERAYPGHRNPFTNFQERVGELLAHHESRLNDTMELLCEPQTAYQVCVALFGKRLTIHQIRFAMSETLAHLIELKRLDRIREEERDGQIVFRKYNPR